MKKSIISTIILFCFLLSNLHVSAEKLRAEGSEDAGNITITVNTPGTFGSELFKVVDQWTDVEYLTVIGSLNDDDINYFSHMSNIVKLDLSQTDITYIGNCNGLSKLTTVVLPESVTSVAASAFSRCSLLQQVNLPNVVSVGDYAFRYCSSLTSIDLPMAQSVGDDAFYACSSLTSIDLPMAQSVGEYAFRDCSSLTSIDLPMAQSVGDDAFEDCSSLTSIDLPMAQSVGKYAFYNCSSLTSIDLPMAQSVGDRAFEECNSLTSIDLPMAQSVGYHAFDSCSSLTSIDLPVVQSVGWDAFYYCSSLTEIALSSHLQSLGRDAFYGCSKLTDVYCYAVVPPYSESTGISTATLHVPEMSLSAYKLHDSWYGYASIVPIEGDIADISICSDYAIYDYNGIANEPNITLTPQAHLTIDGGSELAVNEYVQNAELNYYSTYSTLITQNPVVANSVTLNLSVENREWKFVSFPFDVRVGDIQLPEGTLWVVRRYSGENRAAMAADTWLNMTDDMILNAGEGYIINCMNENYGSEGIPMTVHAIDNANKNNIFASTDVTKTLTEYPAEFANNSSWNLVGNPYPAYLNIKSIVHEAPITVWNGSGYTAYSTVDDDYTIAPFSAFFVQCPENATGMTFAADGRSHTKVTSNNNNYYSKSLLKAEAAERVVMNITLAGNDYTDRTRLVLNEKAMEEYEMARDASKFMSSDKAVPQIYMIENGQRYSIDERPVGNGTFALGTYFGNSADYTISLDVKNFAGEVILTDKATGVSTDMTQFDYTFTAETGTYNDRFVLTVNSDATAVSRVENDQKKHDVYNVGGVKVDDNARGLLIIDGKKVVK